MRKVRRSPFSSGGPTNSTCRRFGSTPLQAVEPSQGGFRAPDNGQSGIGHCGRVGIAQGSFGFGKVTEGQLRLAQP